MRTKLSSFLKLDLSAHTERTLLHPLNPGGGDVPIPGLQGYSDVLVLDRTVSRPRKRRYNERVTGLRETTPLFAPESYIFTA